MKYLGVASMAVLLAFSSSTAFAHGNGKHKIPKKVSSAMMSAEAVDSVDHRGMQSMDNEKMRTAMNQTAQTDFETIRAEVQNSRPFIVIKALALAIAIAGLAILYLPRKSRGNKT
jgi:hypothetical protein